MPAVGKTGTEMLQVFCTLYGNQTVPSSSRTLSILLAVGEICNRTAADALGSVWQTNSFLFWGAGSGLASHVQEWL
jgi:hypothetical protein